MRIGIDISQIVYEGTGVGTYVRNIVAALVTLDKKNEYVLFGASFRQKDAFQKFYDTLPHDRVRLITVSIPPTLLDILWNRLHILPVEKMTGPLDIFWSSDWTQPPLTRAKGITTIHDLSTMLFPGEMDATIRETHARRAKRVQEECSMILCDSEATKKDVVRLLAIPEKKLRVVYPGVTL